MRDNSMSTTPSSPSSSSYAPPNTSPNDGVTRGKDASFCRVTPKPTHSPVLHSLSGRLVTTAVLDHHVGIFHVVTDHVIESDVEFEEEVVHCE